MSYYTFPLSFLTSCREPAKLYQAMLYSSAMRAANAIGIESGIEDRAYGCPEAHWPSDFDTDYNPEHQKLLAGLAMLDLWPRQPWSLQGFVDDTSWSVTVMSLYEDHWGPSPLVLVAAGIVHSWVRGELPSTPFRLLCAHNAIIGRKSHYILHRSRLIAGHSGHKSLTDLDGDEGIQITVKTLRYWLDYLERKGLIMRERQGRRATRFGRGISREQLQAICATTLTRPGSA